MTDMGTPYGFYEDDEPVAEVMAAFERGEHGITRAPVVIETTGLAAASDAGTGTFAAKLNVAPAPIQAVRVAVHGAA